MAGRRYWSGFATGAVAGFSAGVGAVLFTNFWGRAGQSRIVRLEKSIQIGAPVEEVFEAWRQLDLLPQTSWRVEQLRHHGRRSSWRVNVGGRSLRWEAEIEQLIPNQSIGWKSLRGVKHSGRIVFSPLGQDTLVHIAMNYVPPFRLLRPFLAPMSGQLEGYIEEVLRDFKRAVESGEAALAGPAAHLSGPKSYPGGTTTEPPRATGTLGPTPSETSHGVHSRLGAPPHPGEHAAPPEAKR